MSQGQTLSDKYDKENAISSAPEPHPDSNDQGAMSDETEKGNLQLMVESQDQQPGNNAPPPPPNGGYGWVVTIAICIINAHTWGMNSSYGVFLAYYIKNNTFPEATTLQYAFVGSLSISCAMGISPFATWAVKKFGTRQVMLLGVFVEAASWIAASFAHKIWHLFLTQGVCFGLGMGCLFTATVGIIPQWFTTHRSLANGIAAAGSGLGGLVYSFAAGAMIQNLGLAWAFRILGIIAFVVNFICSLLVKDRNKIVGSTHIAFKSTLLTRPEFLLFILFGWFSILGYSVVIFSLANYANEIGLDSSQAALINAFFNLGQSIGRPIMGYSSDRTGRMNMAAICSFLAGIFSLAVWINAKVYGVLIFYAIICGSVAGTFWTVVGPVAAEIVGLQDVPSALNLLWLMILPPCTFSEPIALQIVTGTGSYLGTQLWTGLMFIAATICMVILRGWKIGEIEELARANNERPEDLDPYKTNNGEELIEQGRKAGRRRMLVDFYRKRVV
ncbi:MFS general substrate transporter [Trichoderma citrinoviride]|uniref:MFS general substrate transporter n=1 Tax=Trichoderma citrinoviride TaxID=58853 RepID=A0A2T4BHP4_9HYPO|nr:MFS general substrate transporter [Trichoderma citrinoviride]PTB68798.1 MFS general substrate transporter [Trichoderma citrinoviride]